MSVLFRVGKSLLPKPIRGFLRRRWYDLAMLRIPYVQHKQIGGVAFSFQINDRAAVEWYADRRNLSVEERFMRDRMVCRGDVVLECGAHHGFETILLAHWVGSEGKVIVMEASPKNARILSANVQMNHLSNVIVEAKAGGPTSGKIRLANESNAFVVSTEANALDVPVVPLDEYAHWHPNLLKIDVEGFEVDVLKGARSILATRPKIAIEVHAHFLPRYGASADDLIPLLGADCYEFWLQPGNDARPEPYDGRSLSALQHISQLHLYGIPKRNA